MTAEPSTYHQVGAPEVVRKARCSRVLSPVASFVGSPRNLALLLATLCTGYWAEMRTRVVLHTTKLCVSRITAWWLGNPKCKNGVPPDVERKTYTFPEVRWEGDDAFWQHMPCPRSSYQVTIPPALIKAGGIQPEDDCSGATIVTAFFDIGRGNWKSGYSRKLDDYFRDSKGVMLTLKNPQVWFTQPEFVDIIMSERRKHGLENRTIVFAHAHQCMPTAGLFNRTAEAMCKNSFLDYFWETWAPEQLYPWYSVIMWSKLPWTQAATDIPLVKAPYYIWLDAGCHYPVCQTEKHPHMCLLPWSGTNTSRLRMAAPEPMTPDAMSLSDWGYDRLRRMVIAGTIFGGAPEAIARGRRVFMAKVEELLKAGIPDMDQPVWGMILKANSTPDHGTDLMEPYYTAYEWLPVLDWFFDPPKGTTAQQMWPFREQAGVYKLP